MGHPVKHTFLQKIEGTEIMQRHLFNNYEIKAHFIRTSTMKSYPSMFRKARAIKNKFINHRLITHNL